MKYDLEKRIFLLEKYIKFEQISSVQHAYRSKFKNEPAPGHNTIMGIVSAFKTTGSVLPKPPIKKQPCEKREEAKNQLKDMVADSATFSSRKASSALGISQTLVLSILHDDLHLKPYKHHKWHKLEVHDYEKRVEFATWFLSLAAQVKFFFYFSDEAYFYLTQPINSQNNRIWAEDQPLEGVEMPLHDKKVLVWCAISAEGIMGPYYFEESVNKDNYLEMLKTYFWRRHVQTPNNTKYYFQQDGATPHTADTVQNWLKDKFSKKFVHKKMWPARSPDLNPCDFYLWGHLKAVVYNPLPKTLEDLKANITREIKKIPKNVLNSVFLNLENSCKKVISAEGGHIETK